MEDEIEDIVGDVKLTESQKSVATSNVYSMDFTDCSSDKNHSSGMETYVLEHYDSDDSETYIPVHKDATTINLKDNRRNKDIQCNSVDITNIAPSTSVKNCSVVAQEIFTQTSKTIIELAQAEDNKQTLETQTSFVSITKHRTFEYRIEVSNGNQHLADNYGTVLTSALEEESSKFQGSDLETVKSDDNMTAVSSDDRIINILDAESKDNILSYERNELTSEFDESNDSDIEEDSLMEKKDHDDQRSESDEETRKAVDNEIEDLYNKLAGNGEINAMDQSKRCRALTPLTEESTKRESLIDMTSESKQVANSVEDSDKDVLFTNFSGGKVKMLPRKENRQEFKLPPIQNRSCPNSPHLNFLFSVHPSNKLNKAGTLPCLYEASDRGMDRWEIKTKSLASGESAFISGGSEDPARTNGSIHLPPIHIEGYVVNSKITKTASKPAAAVNRTSTEIDHDDISITNKIKELKMSKSAKSHTPMKYNISESRSCSPCSRDSHDESAERGCEALCVELIRRLRASSWFEVTDTLSEVPKVLEKFWSHIAEQRIADLIRQVSAHVESPRTQVARTACHALACILKNTNYTKKPDFYEAVTLLLTKTGSFSRPVRRAANVALDAVVCGVELSHAVTALCVHGVDHKSPLVRCAAARLLVVSCALGGGGRGLLRARPPSAAAARRHALRALAALLDDKNTDARKYAERLYAMLRPLANFEAYYLTDVEVELASRQMKKYDRLLACAPKDAR